MSDVPDVSYKNFPGEYNAVNPAVTPPGAAQLILNGVVRNHGVLEPVRGFSTPPYSLSTAPAVIGAMDAARVFMATPADNVTSNTSPAPNANAILYGLDAIGNFNPQAPVRQFGWDMGMPSPSTNYSLAFFAAQRQGWMMSGRGLMKVERQIDTLGGTGTPPNLISTYLPTCVPRNADDSINQIGSFRITTFNSAVTAQNWLNPLYSVAYRLVICRRDPVTGQIRFGEPSARITLNNLTGGQSAITMSIFTPYGVPPDAFVQVYRSISVPPNVNPSDEMYQVGELPFATGNTSYYGFAGVGISNSTTFVDVTPDSQAQVPLYTNRGLGNGLQSSKYPAPLANVSGFFQGRAYYGDTQTQQSMLIQISGTSKTVTVGSLQPGDTITIDGVVYTGVTNAVAGPFFSIYDATTAFAFVTQGISSSIRLTAQSLCTAIQNYYITGNPGLPLDQVIQADYISTGAGDEGQILLRRPRPGSPPFVVTTSANRGWTQNLSGGVTSQAAVAPAGITFSDLNQPDSCPLSNGPNIIGNPNARVLAFVPLRDFGVIFKEDGAYIVRETTRGPQFSPLDTTVHLVAPRTAVALGNECYALTAQGVVRIYEGGVDNVSIPIQREILGYLQRSQGLFQGAFAVGYEAEREYWLALPSSGTLTQADIVKVYNTKTQAWTTVKTGTLTCGAEVPTSSSVARIATTALALGVNGNYGSGSNPSYVGWLLENKSQTNNDYVGTTVSPVLSAIGNNSDGTYQVSAPPAWNGIITVGSLVRCPSDTVQKTYTVASVGLKADQSALLINLNLMTTSTVPVLTSASIQPAVVTTIRFMPEDAGKPLLEKHWAGIYLWHRYWNGSFMSTAWETEKTPFPVAGTEAGPGAPIPAGSAPASLSGMEPWCFRPWLKQPWMCPAQDYVLSTSMQGDFTRSGILVPTLTYYNALSRFELSQITFNVDGVSDRIIIS